ncbi:hypothetical protein [Acinetobacter guerrae]|uniref:hypothetical protein n=1 Tax=Acinetobacter guerrae TaxID=1843371 RepID=UPI00125F8D75|nr:hypothetical protein [Acinetobacter guerrae]
MLYVIPFIILLIIAVVLKKREAGKEEQNLANKANAKKKGKKTVGRTASRPRAESKEVTPTIIAEQKKTTPVSQELHQKIVSWIQSGNYSTAEAQINQALNRDNSQHGLYLHLLDIHILQKDEFAIDQLITHLRALDLQDIVMQAEAKKREYEQKKQPEGIDYSSDSLNFQSVGNEKLSETPQNAMTDADFDALVQTQAQSNESTATDSIKIEKDSVSEVEPLEFNFSFDSSTKVTEQSTDLAEPLSEKPTDLSEFSLTLEPREVSSNHIETGKNIDVDLLKASPTEIDPPKVSLDFSNLDFATQPSLESTNERIETQVEDTAEALPEFKFDQLELESTSAPFETKLEPASSVEQTTKQALETYTDVSKGSSSFDLNDPLVQSFPELGQINEPQLDLDLAKQYIELGAYDSARILLTKNQATFSPEQHELSKNLLNRIAS